jgi:hypothetical protein
MQFIGNKELMDGKVGMKQMKLSNAIIIILIIKENGNLIYIM